MIKKISLVILAAGLAGLSSVQATPLDNALRNYREYRIAYHRLTREFTGETGDTHTLASTGVFGYDLRAREAAIRNLVRTIIFNGFDAGLVDLNAIVAEERDFEQRLRNALAERRRSIFFDDTDAHNVLYPFVPRLEEWINEARLEREQQQARALTYVTAGIRGALQYAFAAVTAVIALNSQKLSAK